MARIAGINIPQNKVVSVALTYITWDRFIFFKKNLRKVEYTNFKRVNELSEEQVLKIREFIDANHKVEGDLRREVSVNIKRLVDLACYRGTRHKKNFLLEVKEHNAMQEQEKEKRLLSLQEKN